MKTFLNQNLNRKINSIEQIGRVQLDSIEVFVIDCHRTAAAQIHLNLIEVTSALRYRIDTFK